MEEFNYETLFFWKRKMSKLITDYQANNKMTILIKTIFKSSILKTIFEEQSKILKKMDCKKRKRREKQRNKTKIIRIQKGLLIRKNKFFFTRNKNAQFKVSSKFCQTF